MPAVDLASEDTSPGIDALVTRFMGILFDATGLVQFGPAFVLLLAHADSRTPLEWAAVLAPLSVWAAARVGLRAPLRYAGMSLAGLLLLLSPLLIAPLGAPAFILMVTIADSLVITGVLAYRARWSLALIALVTAILGLSGLTQEPAALQVTDLDVYIGMLLCAVSGVGLLVTRVKFVEIWRSSDNAAARLARRTARSHRESARMLARAGAERSIHETVLNTLTAVSLGVGVDKPAEIRQACKSSLANLDSIPRPIHESTLSSTVLSATETAENFHVECLVTGDGSARLDDHSARVLRDSMVEALQNVARHSGVKNARIDLTVTDMAVVTISDDGCGFSSLQPEKFGIKHSIRRSLSHIGGSAEISSRIGVGTTVTLRVPLRGDFVNAEERSTPQLNLDSSLMARLGLLGTAAVLAMSSPRLNQEIGGSPWFTAATIAGLALGLALAILWNSRFRMTLACSSIAACGVICLLGVSNGVTCSSGSGVVWLIGLTGGGGAVLTAIAPRTQSHRLVAIFLVSCTGVLVLFHLPAECRAQASLPVFTNLVYLMSVWLILRWGEQIFLARRVAAQESWLRNQQRRLLKARLAASLDGWSAVDSETRLFLARMVSGEQDPWKPATQVTARGLAAAIRARLGNEDPASPGDGVCSFIEELGRSSPGTCRIEQLTALSDDHPLPEPLKAALAQVFRLAGSHDISVSVSELDDTLIVVIATAWDAVKAAGDLPFEALQPDYRLKVYQDGVNASLGCLVLERPSAASAHGNRPA